jgi:hypothetical protein
LLAPQGFLSMVSDRDNKEVTAHRHLTKISEFSCEPLRRKYEVRTSCISPSLFIELKPHMNAAKNINE